MKVLIILKMFGEMNPTDRDYLMDNYEFSTLQHVSETGETTTSKGVKYIIDCNHYSYKYDFIPFVEISEELLKRINDES